MKDTNNIIPTNYDITISKCRFGINFAIKKNVSENIFFNNNIYEDYNYLKEAEYKCYNIVISPYVSYFVRDCPVDCNTYKRNYINYELDEF